MHEFLEFTILGLVFGSVYAVASSGLVVTYATTGIFNIAHGAIGMLMAYVYWQLSVGWGWGAPLSLVVTVLGIAPVFGIMFEWVIRPISDATVATKLAMTIAFTVLLIGLVEWRWTGPDRQMPSFFGNHGFHFVSVFVTWEDLIAVGIAIGVALGLRLILFGSRIGIAMRGVVDNRGLVALNGGRPVRIGQMSWALGSSLAALAGILAAQALIHQLSVLPLTLLVIDAYAAAMFGRLRNLPMTFAGAIGIALLQNYWIGYAPQGGVWGSVPFQGLGLSIPAVLLFLVLLAMPQDQLRGATLSARRLATSVPTFGSSIGGGIILVGGIALVTAFLGAGNIIYVGEGLAFAMIMLSVVPLTGWAGQLSLCPMTFAGIGAVAMHHFGGGGSVVGLLAAVGITGAVGAVVALPALRLRGLYLGLATLAFALCMDNMFFPSSTAFSYNGSVPIPRPSIFGLHMTSARSFDIFLAVVFALLSIGLLALRRGPFGRVLAAMKDSEAACATLGLNLTLSKLAVFALSAGLAGLAGALFGAAESVAGAVAFETFQNLPIILLVIIGGVTTCSGALFGGLVLGFGPAIQNALPSVSNTTFLGTGVWAIAVIRYLPDGLLPPMFSAAKVASATPGPSSKAVTGERGTAPAALAG